MKIQRIYNLPNCTLLVDGISLGESDVLSIPTSFEYQFFHTQERIVGGRGLLEALVKAASQYVQALQMLRTITFDIHHNGAAVSLKPVSDHLHQLHLQPTAEDSADPKPIAIQLSTVQLFDLIDSIDQLCSDPQTLPDLQLVFAPPKDKVPVQAGVKIIPAAIGIAGLAIAAITLNFIPVPSPPPKPKLQESSQTQTPQPKADTQPNATSAPSPTPSPASQPDSTSQSSPASSGNPSVPPTSDPSPLPESIKDTEQVAKLQKDLEEKLDKAWTDTPKFNVILTYRVAVNAQGEIVGYKSADTLTPPEENTLPLKNLLVTPTDPETGGSPSQAQSTVEFLVTFTPGGRLTVQPSRSPQ